MVFANWLDMSNRQVHQSQKSHHEIYETDQSRRKYSKVVTPPLSKIVKLLPFYFNCCVG
jgi:hypothetical protein